jgi:hypothetical protein
MDRVDVARSSSITPPEWCFEEAQKKIKAGHYDFEVDLQLLRAAEQPSAATEAVPSVQTAVPANDPVPRS